MIDPRFYTILSPLSLGEIADRFRADLPTSSVADEMIYLPSALANSQAGHISFFSDKRRSDQLETAKASVCLTTEKLFPLVAKTGMISLVTKSPRADFARLSGELVGLGGSERLETQIDPTAIVHPSAVIGEGVLIGARTRVGANCVIGDGVMIGEDCIIEPLVGLSFSRLGDRCHIKSSAVIGGAGFGMAEDVKGLFNIPHLGRVVIQNDVHIGSNCCVDRGQLGDTIISNSVKIDNLVQIAHNVFIDEGAMIAGQSGVSGSCVIGKKAILAGGAALADHITVGDGAIVAAYAGVMSDIPPGEMHSGVPAMPVREHMRTVATLKKLAKRS